MQFLSMSFLNYKCYEWIVLLLLLLPQGIMDILKKEVPIVPNLVGLAIFQIIMEPCSLWNHVWAIIPGVIIMIVSGIFTNSIGKGDGLVVMVIGSLLGINKVAEVIMRAFLLSGLFGIVYIISKKGGKKDQIPFVPFLLLGTLWSGIA